MAVVKFCLVARAKIVGTLIMPWSGSQSFHRVLCFSGPTPVSIEVCEVNVMLGKMVWAVQLVAPSSESLNTVGILLCFMTLGLPPSKLTMKTWSVRRSAWAGWASNNKSKPLALAATSTEAISLAARARPKLVDLVSFGERITSSVSFK